MKRNTETDSKFVVWLPRPWAHQYYLPILQTCPLNRLLFSPSWELPLFITNPEPFAHTYTTPPIPKGPNFIFILHYSRIGFLANNFVSNLDLFPMVPSIDIVLRFYSIDSIFLLKTLWWAVEYTLQHAISTKQDPNSLAPAGKHALHTHWGINGPLLGYFCFVCFKVYLFILRERETA